MNNRLFFYPDLRRYVFFSAEVLDYMYAHIQRKSNQTEAGGEIFTEDPDTHGLIIITATGPNSGDRRERYSFNPDIKAATHDRNHQFAQGRHSVGLWHTHPEEFPFPSGLDRQTTEKYLESFRDDRERYLMVILGNRGDPANMVVMSAGKSEKNKRWVELIESKNLGTENQCSS